MLQVQAKRQYRDLENYENELSVKLKSIPHGTDQMFYSEGKLDLNGFLVKNPSETFLIRVTGDSMLDAGISSGDILVVDRSLEPKSGNIIVASINNELLVKRIRFGQEEIILIPENNKYKPLKISIEDRFEIWGVVTSVIKNI